MRGPAFVGTYHLAGQPANSTYTYGRYHNPTWTLYEQALGELEGGPVVAFASGMAVVSAALDSVLRPRDLVMGHVAAGDPEWSEKLGSWRSQMGAIPGRMEVWLAHRSLTTLDLRLERMCANALAIAEFLAGRPEVSRLRYPGLPGDPAHEGASRQMSRYGPIVSFELEGRSTAERFLEACNLVLQATSFGGVHTTTERRARWGGDMVPEGFIRLRVGCEDPEDLVADLAQALAERH